MNNNYKFLFLFLLSLQNIKACFVTPEDKKIVSEYFDNLLQSAGIQDLLKNNYGVTCLQLKVRIAVLKSKKKHKIPVIWQDIKSYKSGVLNDFDDTECFILKNYTDEQLMLAFMQWAQREVLNSPIGFANGILSIQKTSKSDVKGYIKFFGED
jgi:hypothetical protein